MGASEYLLYVWLTTNNGKEQPFPQKIYTLNAQVNPTKTLQSEANSQLIRKLQFNLITTWTKSNICKICEHKSHDTKS